MAQMLLFALNFRSRVYDLTSSTAVNTIPKRKRRDMN